MDQYFFEVLALRAKCGEDAPKRIPQVVTESKKSRLIGCFNSDFGEYKIDNKYVSAYEHLCFRIKNAIIEVCNTAADRGHFGVSITCEDRIISSTEISLHTQNYVPPDIMTFAFADVVNSFKTVVDMNPIVKSRVVLQDERSCRIEWPYVNAV